MNLTNCPACSHQISDQASKCPSCGQPLRRWARGLYAVKLVLVLVLVLVAGWFLLSTALDMHHAAEGPINITVHGK